MAGRTRGVCRVAAAKRARGTECQTCTDIKLLVRYPTMPLLFWPRCRSRVFGRNRASVSMYFTFYRKNRLWSLVFRRNSARCTQHPLTEKIAQQQHERATCRCLQERCECKMVLESSLRSKHQCQSLKFDVFFFNHHYMVLCKFELRLSVSKCKLCCLRLLLPLLRGNLGIAIIAFRPVFRCAGFNRNWKMGLTSLQHRSRTAQQTSKPLKVAG